MLHAGLDLSRKKLDVCLLSEDGEHLDQLATAPDADSLRRLARRIDELHAMPVRAVVESMTGARLVHDTLEQEGWAVEIADAQKVKGLAPLACKTDKIDSLVLAMLSQRDLVPAIWLPDPTVREERELARFRLIETRSGALYERSGFEGALASRASPQGPLRPVHQSTPGVPGAIGNLLRARVSARRAEQEPAKQRRPKYGSSSSG
jgi:hypothetical protein